MHERSAFSNWVLHNFMASVIKLHFMSLWFSHRYPHFQQICTHWSLTSNVESKTNRNGFKFLSLISILRMRSFKSFSRSIAVNDRIRWIKLKHFKLKVAQFLLLIVGIFLSFHQRRWEKWRETFLPIASRWKLKRNLLFVLWKIEEKSADFFPRTFFTPQKIRFLHFSTVWWRNEKEFSV